MSLDLTNPTAEDLARLPKVPALLLSKQDAARALSISEPTLDRLVKAGVFHPIYLGPQLPRFFVSDLVSDIESLKCAQKIHSNTDAA